MLPRWRPIRGQSIRQTVAERRRGRKGGPGNWLSWRVCVVQVMAYDIKADGGSVARWIVQRWPIDGCAMRRKSGNRAISLSLWAFRTRLAAFAAVQDSNLQDYVLLAGCTAFLASLLVSQSLGPRKARRADSSAARWLFQQRV